MKTQSSVFAQLLGFVPMKHFEYLVHKFAANHGTHSFTAWSHLVAMSYAQLTRRDGLRDLVACLNSQHSKLYSLGLRQKLSRSTLADAAERRDWRLFEALGQRLISQALALHSKEPMVLGLQQPLYAMDSTVIDLCLSLFPWADFRSTKAAVKAHTIIDLRGAIPVFLSITTGKTGDSTALDQVSLPSGAIVVLDRGYIDFKRLFGLVQRGCSFVVRSKENLHYSCSQAHEVDAKAGVIRDQTIALVNGIPKAGYPQSLRRIRFYDCESGLHLIFLTNRFDLPAATIAAIYKQRWQIELFFKWLKQNLCIKHFYGNSLNAVKSQIWIAVCVYLLALIARKELALDLPLQMLLQLVEVNMFEKISLKQMVRNALPSHEERQLSAQLDLF
jgi:Transposase DDE domain/Domain of unknown function (DUF4372)